MLASTMGTERGGGSSCAACRHGRAMRAFSPQSGTAKLAILSGAVSHPWKTLERESEALAGSTVGQPLLCTGSAHSDAVKALAASKGIGGLSRAF